MTSNHHAPYVLGYTRVTMCMKSESLVNADQHAALNTFPGLVHTARHTMEVDHARSTWANHLGAAS